MNKRFVYKPDDQIEVLTGEDIEAQLRAMGIELTGEDIEAQLRAMGIEPIQSAETTEPTPK